MTCTRLPTRAPEPPVCRPYSDSQKGGTLIAEDVHDLATHELRLEDPDAYRPSVCPRCGAALHVHDRRARMLRGEPRATRLLRFRCADRKRCGATWQILPAFLARCLRGTWSEVRKAVAAGATAAVPARTRRRWKARLASSARDLVVALSTAIDGVATRIAIAAGLDARRSDVVQCYSVARGPGTGPFTPEPLAELAAIVHRVVPGVRLM